MLGLAEQVFPFDKLERDCNLPQAESARRQRGLLLLCRHKPVTWRVRNRAGYDGVGPATIVRIFLASLGQGGLPAAPGQKNFWIVHCANPGDAGIGQRFDPLSRPFRGQHGTIDDVETNPASLLNIMLV